MPALTEKILAGFFLILLIIGILYRVQPASAAISACTASVSPYIVNAGANSNLTFSITNSDSSNVIQWVKISRPTVYFTVKSGSASGWSTSVTDSDITFTAGGIGAGGSDTFTVNVSTLPSEQSSANWTVEVSDYPSGIDKTTCTGDTGVTISTPPTISGIHIDQVGQNFARVNWTTNELADSLVEHGLDISYGSQISDGNLVVTHLIELTGLIPGMTYHYRVTSADSVGGMSVSGDHTFTTLPAPTPTFTPTPTNTPTPSPTPLPWQKHGNPGLPTFRGPDPLPQPHPCPHFLPNFFCWLIDP